MLLKRVPIVFVYMLFIYELTYFSDQVTMVVMAV